MDPGIFDKHRLLIAPVFFKDGRAFQHWWNLSEIHPELRDEHQKPVLWPIERVQGAPVLSKSCTGRLTSLL